LLERIENDAAAAPAKQIHRGDDHAPRGDDGRQREGRNFPSSTEELADKPLVTGRTIDDSEHDREHGASSGTDFRIPPKLRSGEKWRRSYRYPHEEQAPVECVVIIPAARPARSATVRAQMPTSQAEVRDGRVGDHLLEVGLDHATSPP